MLEINGYSATGRTNKVGEKRSGLLGRSGEWYEHRDIQCYTMCLTSSGPLCQDFPHLSTRTSLITNSIT